MLGKIILASLLVLAVPAAAQVQQKTYKIGYILPVNSQLGAAATAFADDVAKRTGGKVKIEQYPNSALGGEVDMLSGLQLGTVDVAVVTGAPLPNVVPEVGVFSVPFIFRNVAHAHAVLDGPLGQSYLEKFKDKGMIALAWGENGMRHITNSKRPIRTADDLKGLKLRLPQSDVMAAGFKALGADVGALGFPQLYGALQTGQFDGQENPIATIQSAKFFQVQKYLTLSGHVYDPAVILVSGETWKELTDSEKAAMLEAAKAGALASRNYAAEAEKSGVEALRKQGMEVVEQIDRAAFTSGLQSVRGEYEKKFGAETLKKIESVQ